MIGGDQPISSLPDTKSCASRLGENGPDEAKCQVTSNIRPAHSLSISLFGFFKPEKHIIIALLSNSILQVKYYAGVEEFYHFNGLCVGLEARPIDVFRKHESGVLSSNKSSDLVRLLLSLLLSL
jgi:hypothetical protein